MSIFDAIKEFNADKVAAAIKANAGAVNARDSAGRTPLMNVALHRCKDDKEAKECTRIVNELLDAKADVHATDFNAGRTALHWACEIDNLAFYQALHGKHPDLWYHLRDDGNKSPVIIAREKQFTDMMKAMEGDRRAKAGKGPVQLAIIGVGACGAGMFIRLVKRLMMTGDRFSSSWLKEYEITLIDNKKKLGGGTAYSRELNSETSLLNVQAGGMSIDHDNPLDFVMWLKELELNGELLKSLGEAATQGLCAASARVDGYYPRVLFGDYVSGRLAEWIRKANSAGIKVKAFPESEVLTYELKGEFYQYKFKHGGKEESAVATHFFHATGHWVEQAGSVQDYEKLPGYIKFPASRETLEHKGLFKPKDPDIAIIGSSLSAIDAIFSILLDPRIGHLNWVGDEPTYLRVPSATDPLRITCYSRRGLFPKVRPLENQDIDLFLLNPKFVAELKNVDQNRISLDSALKLLNEELTLQLGRPIEAMKEANPFAQKDYVGSRNPFDYLHTEIQTATAGDGRNEHHEYVRWYQVMHSLFPVARKLYRQFTAEERMEFDAVYNSAFLWAFAPMPERSAKVLLAMHRAGALDLHRVVGMPEEVFSLSAKFNEHGALVTTDSVKKTFNVTYKDYENKENSMVHDFLIDTMGLASRFYRDISPLSIDLQAKGQFCFSEPGEKLMMPENNTFMTDDGTFELLDSKHKHSSHRRGVGFFVHSQLFDVQSVPTVVKYATQATELYYEEYVFRTGHSLVSEFSKTAPQGLKK